MRLCDREHMYFSGKDDRHMQDDGNPIPALLDDENSEWE
jgi:hypothetical protein